MGKYEPLKTFLLSSHDDEVALSFDEIERLIGAVLPPSQKHPAWWSNNPANNPPYIHAVATGTIISVVSGGIGTILVVLAVAWIWPEIRKYGKLA